MKNKILTALWCANGALFAAYAAGATGHWFMAPWAALLWFGLSVPRWRLKRAERHADDWHDLYMACPACSRSDEDVE